VEDAARRLRANDPRLDPALARRLAEKGTAPTPDGRLRFKHDPLHTTVGPYGFQTDIAARFWTKITCPTLLVEAEHSLFRHPPEEAARRHGFFKDARHAVLPGAAHMMQRHAPAGLAALLVEFLRSP
jgi:pimeloyl-ACP methyl ester carboxylesterase